MYYKPLEQFTLKIFFKQKIILNFYYILDFMDIMLFFNILITFIIYINYKTFIIKKRSLQILNPIVHRFLRNILIGQLSYSGEYYFLAIIILFFNILTFNLLGMLPGFFCVTAQLGVALSLSFSIFISAVYFIFHNCGLYYFINLFIPQGVPKILLPLLFILEFISFLSRAFSLAIRLFANMVAGHSLLHILCGAIISISNSFKKLDNILIFFILIPFIIILLVYFLELGIAFLQSYVFMMLSLIYLKDTLVQTKSKEMGQFKVVIKKRGKKLIKKKVIW